MAKRKPPGVRMPIARHLAGFSSVSHESLPVHSGVFLISCEIADVHFPLYAAFVSNIAKSAADAMRQLNFQAECSGSLHYSVFETTDTQKGAAMAQALSQYCRHK